MNFTSAPTAAMALETSYFVTTAPALNVRQTSILGLAVPLRLTSLRSTMLFISRLTVATGPAANYGATMAQVPRACRTCTQGLSALRRLTWSFSITLSISLRTATMVLAMSYGDLMAPLALVRPILPPEQTVHLLLSWPS